MPEIPTALTPTETWITLPEAARLRQVQPHLFYQAVRYRRIEGRRIPTSFGPNAYRWEVKLSDVMAIVFEPKPRRGARGVYTGPVTERTLDRLMDAIESALERCNNYRLDAIFVKAESDKDDEERMA